MKIKIPLTNKYITIATKNSGLGFSLAMGGSWMSNNPKAYIDQGYKLNPHLYSIVSRISRIASMAKWQQFSTTGEKEEEMLGTSELYTLNNPNRSQSRKEWIECAIAYKLLLGERFILLGKPSEGMNAGKVKELHHLPPPMMDVKFTKLGEPILFKWGVGHDQEVIDPDNMIYSKYWNPITNQRDFRGLSPLEAGRRVLTQSNDVYLAGSMLLKNLGAQGMMTLDEDDDTDLDQPQIDQAQNTFQSKFAGASNIMKMWFSTVKWKYTKISQNAKEIGLNEAHLQTLRDMCNIYGVFSQIFNDPTSKAYANVGEARKDLIMNVVLPELESLAGELSRAMLPDGQEFRVDTSVYPELKKELKELVESLDKAWWLTPNRRLEIMGEEPSTDPLMNQIWTPTSIMPLDADVGEGLDKLLK